MKKLTLLLLIVLNINSVAQNNYFEKKILWGYLLQQIWKVENTNNGEYVVLGHILESGLPYTYSFFSKMNANGDIYPPVYYKQDTANYYATDLLANEQGYAISIAIDLDTHNHPQYHDNMYFVQTDTNGQILYQHPIGYPGNTNSNDLMSMIRTPEDGGYLLVGFLSLPFGAYYRPYLVKLNSSGEKQWEKIINEYDATQDNVFNDVVRTPNGEYYAVGGNELETNTVGAVLLAQLDITNGNIIQQWNYNFDSLATNNQSLDDGTTIIALDDGGLLIGLKKENVPQWGSLLRLNSNKEIVWVNNQVLNDCGPRKLLYLPTDGSFVTTGCATVLYPAVSDGVQVEISKVSATGSLLWKRHYGTDHADDYAWDMVSTPDGGFMVVGRSYSIFWQQVPIYLLKTNCMGLLTLPQANFTVAMDTAALRASFYNTSQYIYPDSIDGGHYLWQFGDGSTSVEQNPTHTYAQGGNYTVTLTAVVCSDTSVFVQTVSTWAVGIASPLPPPKEEVWFSPNPATNQTVAYLPSLLCAHSGQLQLFSTTGSLLQSIPYAAKQQTVAFSVAHLPAGIYFVQVGNVVQKLVVE